jgi:hypothetical protein
MARPVSLVWTEEMLWALGKISDTDFADKYGVSIGAIKKKRGELEIPGYKPKPVHWNKFADIFMIASDEQIASVLDMHPITIRRKRSSLIRSGFLDECFNKVSLSNKESVPRIKELAAHILNNEERSKGKPKRKSPVYERKIVRTKLKKSNRRRPSVTFPKELIVAKVQRYPHTALFLTNRSRKVLQEFCEQMSEYHPSCSGFDASLKTMRAWGYNVAERWEILRHFVQQGIDNDRSLAQYHSTI